MTTWKLLIAAALATAATAERKPEGVRATPLFRNTAPREPLALALVNEEGRPATGNIGQRGQQPSAVAVVAPKVTAPVAVKPATPLRARPLMRAPASPAVPIVQPLVNDAGRPACSNMMSKGSTDRCGA
jgi:hypothetical protein